MKKPCHNPHDATFRLFLTDIEVARTFQKLSQKLPEQKEQLMTIAEQLIAEGYREGFREGFREGYREGLELARQEILQKIAPEHLPEGMDIDDLKALIDLCYQELISQHRQK